MQRHIFQHIHILKKLSLSDRPLSLVLIVTYKGLIGVAEIILGLLSLVLSFTIKQGKYSEWLGKIIMKGLRADPQDRFLNWLLIQTQDPHKLYVTSIRIGGLLLIAGIIKLCIVVGIWLRSLLVRNICLIFFSGIAIFGIYHLYLRFSTLKFLALAVDLLILYYFWRILPKHMKHIES